MKKTSRFSLLIALVSLVWIFGCVAPAPQRDPLEGWKADLDDQPNQAIVADYQDYIRNLPAKEREFVQRGIRFFNDGTGQHAIKIEIPLNGVWREHVLIYDKENKRTSVVKYDNGGYRS